MRAIKVWFRVEGIIPEEKMSLIAVLTEVPAIMQKRWKKPECRPSGLGALKGFMELRALRIFMSKTGPTSEFDSSKDKIAPQQGRGSELQA